MMLENLFTIDCGEILLREYRIEDAVSIYNLAMEDEIYRFLPDWRTTREQRLEWVRDYEIPGNQAFLKAVSEGVVPEGYFRLAIILKENGQFIGWCCAGPKEELPKPNTEIFYAISKDYAGRGYITSAAKALIHYLFQETKIETLNALAEIENIASNKVIQKCGFDYVGDIEIYHKMHHHYKMNKDSIINCK
jgi:[ribosomal protein S5]-alanine N-acetyltransferase